MSADYDARCEAAGHIDDFPLPDAFVAPLLRQAASWGAKWAAERLGTRLPRIRFGKASVANVGAGGAAHLGGDEIWLRDDLSLDDAAALAAHEVLHTAGDADETRAEALQRDAKAAWRAERYAQRAQLRRSLEEFYTRMCPSGAWTSDAASLKRLTDWYGAKQIGYTAALVLANRDLGLRLGEFQQLASGAGDLHAHQTVESRQPHAARPQFSFERGVA